MLESVLRICEIKESGRKSIEFTLNSIYTIYGMSIIKKYNICYMDGF